MKLTAAEKKFLERCRAGEGWYVPAQAVMVARLERRGLVAIDRSAKGSRYNRLRGSHERRAELVEVRGG